MRDITIHAFTHSNIQRQLFILIFAMRFKEEIRDDRVESRANSKGHHQY